MNEDAVRMLVDHDRRIGALETVEVATNPLIEWLPGLRGFWPMSSVDEGGDARDLGAQGRTLTNNNVATYNFVDAIASYVEFDGADQDLSRPDENGLDVTGAEGFIDGAIRGVTLGGWFYFDNDAGGTAEGIFSKWEVDATGDRTFMAYRGDSGDSGVLYFYVSGDGTAVDLVASTGELEGRNWYFIVCRFVPSTEIAVFVNNSKDVEVASIPASLHVGPKSFRIGSLEKAASIDYYMDGRASLCFLCAAALSDAIAGALFQRTRHLFGV